MYKYLYAVGRYHGFHPGFHVVDISTWRVGDLEKIFSILYIVVKDEMYNSNSAIMLDDYRTMFIQTPDISIQQWLDNNPALILKTSKYIPENTQSYVKQERLFTHGYFHFPGDINLTKDRQKDLLSDSAPDLLVKHYKYVSGVDYQRQVEHALFSINGVFYRAEAREEGFYLRGAGLDYIKNRQDLRIGALNFQKLGKLECIPIEASKLISIPSNGEPGWKYKLSAKQLEGKTLWLVVNGQLVVDTEMVYRVSSDDVVIKLSAFDAMKHHQVYRDYCRTPDLYDMTKIRRYKEEALAMHNSFFLLIDNPTLGIDVVPLATHLHPNAMHTEERFQHPVVLTNGLFPTPYMRSYGKKQRILNVDLRINRVYPIQTNGVRGGDKLNSLYVNQGDPGALVTGFFFKIHGINFKEQ